MSSIALTTTFQPSPSCLSDVYTTTTGYLGYLSLGPPQSAQCFPSGWQPTSQYFSPGICPSGYEVACQYVNGVETQATCCPSYYSCQTSTNWPQYSTMVCTVVVTDLPSSVTAITSGTSVIPIGLNIGGGINAFGISIRWQEDDFTTSASTSQTSTTQSTSGSSPSIPFSTSTSPSSTTQSTPGTSPSTPFSTSASPSTKAPTSTSISIYAKISQASLVTQKTSSPTSSSVASPRLSTGAEAGIAVGAAIITVIIIILLGFYTMRYRRARLQRSGHELPAGEISQWSAQKPGVEVAGQYELSSSEVTELSSGALLPTELHSESEPSELHAGTYRAS